MIKPVRVLAVGLALALAWLPSAAAADELIGTYVARISWKDHESSTGRRLDTAAQVVRQDRANVHKHIQTDEEDDIDAWFTTNAERTSFEVLLNREGAIDEATRRAIMEGEPLVEVEVYRNSVKVVLLSG
jgi:biotin synthase-related radical SAM superfamily protein